MLRRSLDILMKIFVVLSFLLPTLGIHAQLPFSQKNKAAQLQQQQLAKMQLITSQSQEPSDDEATAGTTVSASVLAKKPGVMRIGLVLPTNNLDAGEKVSDAEALRKAQAQMLTGPSIESVSLRSSLPDQVIAEAKQLDCDFIVLSSLSQQEVKAQGRFARLGGMHTLQMAATAAQFVPGVQATAMLANVAMTTVASQATAQSLSRLSSSVKANTEVTFSYVLQDATGTHVAENKFQARSKADGDDVVPSLLQSAAQQIVAKMQGGSQ